MLSKLWRRSHFFGLAWNFLKVDRQIKPRLLTLCYRKICHVEYSDLYFIGKLIFNIYAVVLEAYGEDGDETTTTPIYADVVEREDEGMYHHLHFIFYIIQ